MAGRRVIAAASDPGALALSAYVYFHIPMVAGIITVAAGDELVIAHPTATTSVSTIAVVVGGPLLFLLGNVLFKRALSGYVPPSRPAAIAALIVIALVSIGIGVSIVVLTLAATLVLVALALWDVRAGNVGLGSGPPWFRERDSKRCRS